jgi:hypothetical protein
MTEPGPKSRTGARQSMPLLDPDPALLKTRFRQVARISLASASVSQRAETAQVTGDPFRLLSGFGAHERFGDKAAAARDEARRRYSVSQDVPKPAILRRSQNP